jgi:hypothetical protein
MQPAVFDAKRVTRSYRQAINAAPEVVFPLLCPVRESEWLEGWCFTMIYSRSGLAEEGAVFSTPQEGEADTVWVVTRHDPQRREVQFARFTHKSRVCVLNIAVHQAEERRSHVDIDYTFTAIAPGGNAFVEAYTEADFLAAVTFWERSMNHFLERGTRLKK